MSGLHVRHLADVQWLDGAPFDDRHWLKQVPVVVPERHPVDYPPDKVVRAIAQDRLAVRSRLPVTQLELVHVIARRGAEYLDEVPLVLGREVDNQMLRPPRNLKRPVRL